MNELLLYGTVGSSFWDEECFTARQVRDELAGMTGPVTVRINSGGGIATEGQAIYSALRGYAGTVDVVIEGIAASAASLIAMAGDTITMTAGAILMIHDPASWYVEGRGTEDDHLHVAKALGVIATAYAGIYAKRAGIGLTEARAIMKAETYFDGAAAVEAGFATATDDEAEGAEVAAFDYRLYARAPEKLRAASGAIRKRKPAATVVAMMAAAAKPATNPKGENMAKKPKATAATAAEGNPDTEAEEEEDPEMEIEDDPDAEEEEDPEAEGEEDPEAEGEDEPEAMSPRALAILNMCARRNVSITRALDMVERGLTTKQAMAEITGKGNQVPTKNNPPRARILRDEVETRRAGMAGALVARMERAADVRGPARDFMSMTLAEMAALSAGHRGRVSRGAGEIRAIEMAFGSHSTSDFPSIFENALNKRLAAAYQAATPVYRAIASRMDFVDFRPHPVSQIGDWPTLLPVGETGEIQYGTTGDKKEILTLVAYARAFRISRQMMINDELSAIDRMLASRGQAVAAFEDATFFAMMLSGANADGPTLLETARQVFNTTDGTKAASGAAVTPTAVALGYQAMRSRKGVSGEAYLAVEPRFLLTGPAKEFEAMQLLAPIQAAQASNVNPYVGKLTPVVTPYITGNAWHMFADPSAIPTFTYGYLQGEAGPRMRTDEPFGTQGIGYSVELDFGVGATDFRGSYKNAGA